MPNRAPRSLTGDAAIAQRQQEMGAPHMLALNRLATDLRAQGRGFVPDFDPFDGGVHAQILFLLDRPFGPQPFLSRDSDDPASAILHDFIDRAGILRPHSLIWGMVPWYGPARADDAAQGIAALQNLLGLLPQLRLIIAMGKTALRARNLVRQHDLAFVPTLHPSPANRAARAEAWAAIPVEWAMAARHYAPKAALSRAAPALLISAMRS